jgi:RND family efflux transporter MFP subunit
MEEPQNDISALRIDRSGPRRKRKPKWPGRLALLILLGGLAWLFQRPLMGLVDQIRLPEVEVSPLALTSPSSATGARGAAANGYVVARTRAALSAEQPGRIVEIKVVEGTRVSKDDVVARLDSTEQEAALAAAKADMEVARASVSTAEADIATSQAQLSRAESGVAPAQAQLDSRGADLDFARREHDRYEELVAQGVAEVQRRDQVVRDLVRAETAQAASEADLEAAFAAVEVARKQVSAAIGRQAEAEARLVGAEAMVKRSEAALEKTYVRAPFDGVIVLKEAEVGEVVSPNSQGGSNARGSVATMVDFTSLEVQAEVPETTLSAVKLGGPARIYLDAFPSEPFAARIDRIWPTADRTKATVEVRVAFEQLDDRLRPDMGVRVVFLDEEPSAPVEEEQPVLLMPSNALVTIAGQRGAFVLERDTVRFRRVEVGETRASRLVVLSGLAAEDRVVVSPPDTLSDGARVRIKQ